MAEDEMKPCAKWTDDCQGKKDYDGRLISISTRYWPAGGGFHYSNPAEFSGKRELKDLAIKPSATASICLNHGEPDEYGFGDYEDLIFEDFSGETEQEVKQQVEEWVQKRFDEVRKLVKEFYGR